MTSAASQLRNVVENVICRMRNWRIVSDVFRHTTPLKKRQSVRPIHQTDAFAAVAWLTNLQMIVRPCRKSDFVQKAVSEGKVYGYPNNPVNPNTQRDAIQNWYNDFARRRQNIVGDQAQQEKRDGVRGFEAADEETQQLAVDLYNAQYASTRATTSRQKAIGASTKEKLHVADDALAAAEGKRRRKKK